MESKINLNTVEDVDLVIATPFYLVEAYAPYTASLAASLKLCWEVGLKTAYEHLCSDSYVWRVRNTLADMFLQTNAKYMIFIDSDHAWDLMGFSNLLKAPGDVVGAAYPCKNNWDFWGVDHQVDADIRQPMGDLKSGLIRASKVPTGFMKISRTAFKKIADNEPDNWYWYEGRKVHGFFNHIVENNTALGEDISFCRRCAKAGIPLWIEPNITISHFAVTPHTGNYHEFLLRQPGGQLYGSDVLNPDSIRRLEGKHKGQTAYVVGKGPSLAFLEAGNFGPGPVIALNQAIIPVERLGLPNPIYSMQKDGNVEHETPPQWATLLVHSRESENTFPGYQPRYVFDNPKDFDIPIQSPSVVSAAVLVKKMGCEKVVYLCCDACINGDTRTYVPKPNTEAEIVLGDDDESYKLYRGQVEFVLAKANIVNEWIMPEQGINPL